jgi:hypothetical protein
VQILDVQMKPNLITFNDKPLSNMRILYILILSTSVFFACKHTVNKKNAALADQNNKDESLNLNPNKLVITKINFSLTEQDKRNYTLSIEQEAMKWKDTTIVWAKKDYHILEIPIKLSNHSNDTLKYIDFNCSWNDIFISSNKDLSKFLKSCLANIQDVFTVLPHQSVVFSLPVTDNKVIVDARDSFRIGMYLCKYKTAQDWIAFDNAWSNKALPRNCLIWSNEVAIPNNSNEFKNPSL